VSSFCWLLQETKSQDANLHIPNPDPFHRVDVLPSGRHVKIEIDGVVLADTGSEGGVMSLWETSFPGRWYLPRTAVCHPKILDVLQMCSQLSQVNWEYLTPSETHSGCPYKGEASYYNAVINGKECKDVVWWYKNPILESAMIIGMVRCLNSLSPPLADTNAVLALLLPRQGRHVDRW
jgi:uncharacterized protein (DUF427 family)